MGKSLKEDIKNARKCENLNDPIDNYVLDYVAIVFSRLFIKLRIIPNVITVLSGLVGVAGGILLCFNSMLTTILGIIMIILSVVFDECDGQVARLTKKYSSFGRTLDGFVDFLVYLSIYIALCVRLYPVNIPFTETPWKLWIIPVAAITLWCFGAQARTLDYFKNLHMYMVKNGGGKQNELTKTEEIKRQLYACKRFSFSRLRLSLYYSYTKLQEKSTPNSQKLLKKIEESGNEIPQSLSDAYKAKSTKYIMLANTLAFNLRTIVLFILLLLPWHLEFFYFPFVVFILEPVRIAVIKKYERLATDISNQYFSKQTETDK